MRTRTFYWHGARVTGFRVKQLPVPVLVVGLLLFAACGPGEETAGEIEVVDVAPGRTSTLTTAYDEVSQRRPENSVGVLPSDFPDALPVYRPASITDFGDANGHRFVLFFSPDELAIVRQRMARELDRTGWALIDRGGERGTYRRGSHSVILDIREARPGTEIRVEY